MNYKYKNKDYKKRFQKGLKKELIEHRKKKNLKQLNVAMLLEKSQSTYQRWEQTGENLTNIYDLLEIFHVLDFSFTEIMEILELPQPNIDELKKFYQDEDIDKILKEASLYNYVCKNCVDMNVMQIDRLLDILSAERLRRRKNKTS